MTLFLSDRRGVHIPRDFIQVTRPECIRGLSDDDRDVLLSGPDHVHYWDVWDHVLNTVTVVDAFGDGIEYRLHQDGDLWLVDTRAEWDDVNETWVLPSISA